MARTIQVTIHPEQTEELLDRLKKQKKYIGLKLQRNCSIDPPGDLVTVDTTNRHLHEVIRLINSVASFNSTNNSLSTTEPLSIVSIGSYKDKVTDTSEMTWEEMEDIIGKESNMTVNALAVMVISGIMAAIGIATNTLHLVIASMLIAPGFEPLSRLALGVTAKGGAAKRGLLYTVMGYAAFSAGALLAGIFLKLKFGVEFNVSSSYIQGSLVSYWTKISPSSLIVSSAASFAGALLIISNRSVLTSGVMVGLALVPTAAIAVMALLEGNIDIFLAGFYRWGLEVFIVILFSLLAFYLTKFTTQKRDFMLKG